MQYFTNGTPRTKLSWTAPTENVDGSPIDYALSYELQEDDVPIISFPGSLNPDGTYSVLLADVPTFTRGDHNLTLEAISDTGVHSADSNVVVLTADVQPGAPLNFFAE